MESSEVGDLFLDGRHVTNVQEFLEQTELYEFEMIELNKEFNRDT